MAGRKRDNEGWNLDAALAELEASTDPYVWEQGLELYRRGAAEDFALRGDGTIQVKVLDPRDARAFFVEVRKDAAGNVVAACKCPYRFEGRCRHQVVALEYLRELARGEAAGEGAAAVELGPQEDSTASARTERGLYALLQRPEVATAPDGSLLRLVLRDLGSTATPHRVALQLFTGSGWTDVRAGNLERWIQRGALGPHPRDVLLARALAPEGELRGEIDSDTLAALLQALAGSDALVDRMGRPLEVSLEPWRLCARLERAEEEGLRARLLCASLSGEERPFDEVYLLPAVAPWIQLESGAFHPLAAGLPGAQLEALQEEDLTELLERDRERFLSEGLRALERAVGGAFEIEEGLVEEVEGVERARLVLEGDARRLSGRLEFAHAGHWVPAPETPEPWSFESEGRILRFPPATQSLARAERELRALGFEPEGGGRWAAGGPGLLARILEPRPQAFVSFVLPERLESLDLVDRAPELRLRVFEDAASQRAGFRVEWELRDGDRALEVDPEALRSAPPGLRLLELPGGEVLSLEHPAVERLRALLAAGEPEAGGAVRLPCLRAGDLLALETEAELEYAPEARAFIERLSGKAAEPPPLRSEVDAVLRGYQKRAVAWFGALRERGLAGILADEMGLGKTLMVLAHLFGRKEAPGASPEAPALVVCPTSLAYNWVDECRRFFPWVDVKALHGLSGAERARVLEEGADLFITSYALLRRDRELHEAREYRAVVLDEAQQIKNPESQTARAAFALRARERWALTGTPLENRLEDLWSLFRFLLPDLLGPLKEFRERFGGAATGGDAERIAEIRARVRPFLLRRTKEEVLSELPPRIDQVERAPLTTLQRRLYEEIAGLAREELEAARSADAAERARARFRVLARLTRLRQVCCHPRLVLDEAGDGGEVEGGGKFELLCELLDEAVEEGHRVLLFSQFTSMLDLIEELLEARGIEFVRLDGSTRDREGVIRRFQERDDLPVFLMSLKAGGFGLNLTQADTVILYDPWWNPAVEEQAAARAHRFGQEVPVHVHRLVAAGTVEERILDLQERKRELAAGVMGGGEDPLEALSLEELETLLG